MVTDYLETDVLIIGSGLAGLRSGIAALEKKGGVKVLVVTKGKGPSGTSFTNRNNALGIQVCFTDSEKDQFVREAELISGPGVINTELAGILADESEDCFRFLKNCDLRFRRSRDGLLKRFYGCFSPETERAFIFTRLSEAFQKLNRKYTSLGGEMIENLELISFITTEHEKDKQVNGGVFLSGDRKQFIVVNAKTTIMASGGTTSLFLRSLGGRAIAGTTPALLSRAGVELVNACYHQFTWQNVETMESVFPYNHPETMRIVLQNKIVQKLPDFGPEIYSGRRTHVPVGYDCKDLMIDQWLYETADVNKIVTITSDSLPSSGIALFAHAWNGGARIDKNGRTSVKGLYACGEAASGMHGANRIGGAMVLSSQVFGRRAGTDAVRVSGQLIPKERFLKTVQEVTKNWSREEIKSETSLIQQELYFSSLAGLFGKKRDFLKNLQKKAPELLTTDHLSTRLMLESAMLITGYKSIPDNLR